MVIVSQTSTHSIKFDKAMMDTTTNIAGREQLFIKLYKSAFPVVARYVSKHGGTFDEAKDVFQDAAMIYYEKSAAMHQPPHNDRAYLMGIAKHLWFKNRRDNSRYVPIDINDSIANIPCGAPQQPLAAKLLDYLETSGQKCMELLKNFYYDKLPMTDIAAAYGFSGIRSATVQKFKCLEKVRNTIKSKALSYEDFID